MNFLSSCETLARDLEECLTFYKYPEAHWKKIRTSNQVERVFREVRRRPKVVGRFPTEKSALVLIWASIEQERLRWYRIRMDDDILKKAIKAKKELSKDIECNIWS